MRVLVTEPQVGRSTSERTKPVTVQHGAECPWSRYLSCRALWLAVEQLELLPPGGIRSLRLWPTVKLRTARS